MTVSPPPDSTDDPDGLAATLARRGRTTIGRIRRLCRDLLDRIRAVAVDPGPAEDRAGAVADRLRASIEGRSIPGRDAIPAVSTDAVDSSLPGELPAERLRELDLPDEGLPGPAVPAQGPSRRTLLAGLGGAAVGATAASPDLLAGALGPLDGFDLALPVDPAATAGPGHGHVLALLPRDEATHRATSNGEWSSAGTWADGEVPHDGARVLVEDGVTVTVARKLSARHKIVRVDGTLAFDRSTDTHLQAETVLTAPGSLLYLGHPEMPIPAGTEARLTFADLGPIDEDRDPERVSTGLLAMGAVSVHGADKTTWTPLAKPPTQGDRTLELPETPTNWELGDRLVVAGNHPVENQDEEVIVTDVDGTTVELDRTLDHDHVPPEDDLDAYVLDRSRNVRIDSENPEVPRRGHVMFMSDEVDVRYAGFYDLGRTDKSYPFTNPVHGNPPKDVPPNPRARYALHFHETGIEDDDPARIEGVAVDGSPGWGIVNHHSHVDVVDSTTYDVFGSGFVAEAGNERGSFRRNFALRSAGSGEVPDSRAFHGGDHRGKVDDFGHGGHGFWLQGPAVAVEDNVAAGHRHYGFVFWNRPLVDRELRPGEEIRDRRGTVQNFPIERFEGYERLKDSELVADGMISSAYVPIQSFRNNTAFASGGGLDLSRHMFGYDHTRVEDYGVVEDFTAYDVGPLVNQWDDVRQPDDHNAQGGNNGITIRYSHNVLVRGARLLGGRDSGLEKATGGVGINRNTPYPFNAVVEDSLVAGWGRGVQAMTRGLYVLRNSKLSNRTNVVVDEHDGGPVRRIALDGLTFERGSGVNVSLEDLEDTDPDELFTSEGGGIELDGRPVYLDAQRPDAVPVPTEAALEKLGHSDHLAELTGGDPEGVLGKSNRELQRQYGIAVHGAVAPPGAEPDPRLEGGLLGPAGDGSPPRERWIEAEDGDLAAPFRVEEDPGASGGAYVVPRGVDSHRDPPSGGDATYVFEVDAGEYLVYGRVHAESGSDDSFWVRIDGGRWHRWNGIRARRGWRWMPVWDDRDDREGPSSFDLDRGRHRLEIAFREDGAKLDRLLVTALDTTPVLDGEPVATGGE